MKNRSFFSTTPVYQDLGLLAMRLAFGGAFFYLLLSGPGRYSLDHYLFDNRSQPVQ